MKRKSYTKEFKTKVAIEAIKGQKTVNEIASEYGVHVSQINSWKKRLLEAAPEIFSRGRDHEAVTQEAERDRLYRKIGRLQVEVDWLKKKTGTSRWNFQAFLVCFGLQLVITILSKHGPDDAHEVASKGADRLVVGFTLGALFFVVAL